MRDELDRFYTPDKTVSKCIKYVDFSKYDVIVEPSAGAGAFLTQINNNIQTSQMIFAFDIEPDVSNIIKNDWLEIRREDIATPSHLLVIGNPPFGARSTLAKNFIKHAIALGAETIAFILPNTFTKKTNQRFFSKDWRLVDIVRLTKEECNFLLSNDEVSNIFIPCSFFVWTRRDDIKPNIDLRDYDVPQPVEYSFLPRGDKQADFTLNGNNGKTKNLSDVTNSKAEHYIKVSPEYEIATIRAMFDKINFTFESSVNGGVAWISQNDINKAFLAEKDKTQ